MTQTQILRTSFDGTYEIHESAWGKYLTKCRDPEANIVITEENLAHFEPREDICKIPSDIWTRWVNLCFHYVDKVPNEMEVSVRFLRMESDPSKYMAIVPRQSVTKSSVNADNFKDSCNLVTGESITTYPPSGWIPIGSSHSHNTMNAFFSPTDDSSQLSDPGIHFTVGEIDTTTMQYKIAASVVGHGRRFILDFNHFIDATYLEDVTFHPNVLEYVDISKPAFPTDYYSKWRNNFHQNLLPPKKTDFETLDEFLNRSEGSNWNYGELQEEFYDSDILKDPFHYNDNPNFNTVSLDRTIHNLQDWVDDYMTENVNDTHALEILKNELLTQISTIESLIKS